MTSIFATRSSTLHSAMATGAKRSRMRRQAFSILFGWCLNRLWRTSLHKCLKWLIVGNFIQETSGKPWEPFSLFHCCWNCKLWVGVDPAHQLDHVLFLVLSAGSTPIWMFYLCGCECASHSIVHKNISWLVHGYIVKLEQQWSGTLFSCDNIHTGMKNNLLAMNKNNSFLHNLPNAKHHCGRSCSPPTSGLSSPLEIQHHSRKNIVIPLFMFVVNLMSGKTILEDFWLGIFAHSTRITAVTCFDSKCQGCSGSGSGSQHCSSLIQADLNIWIENGSVGGTVCS